MVVKQVRPEEEKEVVSLAPLEISATTFLIEILADQLLIIGVVEHI